METMTVNKTYGVKPGVWKGKPYWFVVCDGNQTSLFYARRNFALKQAELFVKNLYKNFVNFQNIKIHFTFSEEK